MVAQPDEELARICAFLGDTTRELPKWRRDLPSDNVSARRLRKSGLRDALNAVPGATALKSLMPESLRERMKSVWRMRERPRLSEAMQARLASTIDEDLARLSQWLGRPITTNTWHDAVADRPLDWAGT